MNIGGYQIAFSTLVLAAVAAVWLLTLLIGMLSWEKGSGRFRVTDIVVLVISVIAGGVWFVILTPRSASAATAGEGVQKRIATCAVIEAGDTEAKVKQRLGDPDEIRGEEEVRGPASNVWIYKDSRCAVHFFGNVVESIE